MNLNETLQQSSKVRDVLPYFHRTVEDEDEELRLAAERGELEALELTLTPNRRSWADPGDRRMTTIGELDARIGSSYRLQRSGMGLSMMVHGAGDDRPMQPRIPAFQRLHPERPTVPEKFSPLVSELGVNRGEIRRNIERQLNELRNNSEKRAAFSLTCRDLLHEKNEIILKRMQDVEARRQRAVPVGERLEEVRARRKEGNTQQVMNPIATVCVPNDLHGNHKDSLLHRRWAVLMILPKLQDLIIGTVIRGRFPERRKIQRAKLGLLFDICENFAEEKKKIEAMKIIDSVALIGAISRRIRRKRSAVQSIRLFLLMQKYVAEIKKGIRLYRNDVLTCQKCIRRYLWRRGQRLQRWLGLWRTLELDLVQGGGGYYGEMNVTTGRPIGSRSDYAIVSEILKPLHRETVHLYLRRVSEWSSMLKGFVPLKRSIDMSMSQGASIGQSMSLGAVLLGSVPSAGTLPNSPAATIDERTGISGRGPPSAFQTQPPFPVFPKILKQDLQPLVRKELESRKAILTEANQAMTANQSSA